MPLARGRKELLAYRDSEPISPGQAIRAKCYECMGYFKDGPADCMTKGCPLYPYMPYNKNRKKKKVNLTDEQRKKIGERLKHPPV